MVTVPLSMAGAFLAMHLTGGTLNVYSQIGLVTLIGLITKHGILIVEFANKAWAEGATRREAALQAAELRLRPILMTTAAMVLGAVPLALAEGAGAESRQQIGWVIVGGMSLGTLLTLFVLPALYAALPERRPAAANAPDVDRSLAGAYQLEVQAAGDFRLAAGVASDDLPGPRNSLTDVAGLAVGSAHDPRAWSGVTVVLPDRPVLAAVDVRGGSPFTVNTAAFDASNIVKALYGLVLSGGSAFGLEAAGGLTSWLAVRGRGILLDGCCIPTVSGAILYDLANGGDKAWGETPPYRALAMQAAEAAGLDFALGNAGAGFGAVAGQIKGGLGTASAIDPTTGVTIAALVAVNPVGSVTMPGSSTHVGLAPGAGGRAGRPDPAHRRHRPPARDQGRHRRQHHHRPHRHRRRPRPGPAAAARGDGAGRLRLRHPPDPHPSRRRRGVRADHRGGAVAADGRHAGAAGRHRRRRHGARRLPGRLRGRGSRRLPQLPVAARAWPDRARDGRLIAPRA